MDAAAAAPARSSEPAGAPSPDAGAQIVVGLDVGTTATKAVAVDLGSAWQHVAQRGYPLLQPEPGHAVQDPRAVLAAVDGALAETVAAVHRAGATVLAVSVSTAMHGLVALDADGAPLTRLLTWADSRSSDQARGLRASGEAVALHRSSGTPVHPMSPMTKLLWFSAHDPGLLRRARWWAGLKDLVLHHLTGRVVTELSSASASGLLDLSSRGWDPAVLDLVGVSAEQLPPVLPTTEVLGMAPAAAGRLGLRTGLPVVAGAGDGPLANLGSGAVAPGVAGLSLGTSGAVRAVVAEPHVDEGGRLFCYALTEDAWVVGGAVSNGGVVTKWAVDTFGRPPATTVGRPGGGRGVAGGTGEEEDSAEERVMDLAATAPPGCDGLVMLPYLLAERAPLWDPDLPGAYLGLRRGHGPAHLVRAAVEGVAVQLAAVTREVDRVQPLHEVRATGGAFRSSLWLDVVAAALDRPLVVAAEAEGTAHGAVALALLALGRADDLAGAVDLLDDHAPPSRPVQPDPALVAAHREVAARLPGLVTALRPVADLLG